MSRTSRSLAAPRRARIMAPLVVVAALVACDDTPTHPSTPRATAIRVEGPASVAPGTTAQYRAIATFTNGSNEDVTSQAAWRSTNASVLVVGAGGTATARALGEAQVFAQYQNPRGFAVVFVLEPGTFRVSGRVTDSGGIGLPGARVAVLADNSAGLTTTTDNSGSYALYGVAGSVQLEVTLDGFDHVRQSIDVTNHSTANSQVRPLIAPTDLGGDWQLRINAAAPCASVLAPDVLTRSYRVTITQTGTFVHVQIKSPPIVNGLSGRVIGSSVTIAAPIDDSYYPYYGVRFYALIETLGPGRFLALGGTMRGDRADDAVIGTLDGELALYRNYDGSSAVWNRDSACPRTDHTFRLDRN